MTDNNSHHEDENSEAKSEPHLKFENGKLLKRTDDGEWVDVTPEPKETGDPVLDALWGMTVSEVEKIAEDDSHPWQEKAKQVQYESLAPLREVAENMFSSLAPKFNYGFPWTKNLFRLDLRWPYLGATFDRDGRPASGEGAEHSFEDPDDPDAVAGFTYGETLEHSAEDAQTEVTMHDVHEVLKYMAAAQDDGNAERSQMRYENLEASKDASKWAEKSHGKATASMWLAAGAMLVGLVSLAATLCGWGAA